MPVYIACYCLRLAVCLLTHPFTIGNKRYELNDWLGNVRVVINDRKTPVNTGTVTISYKPQVVSVSDYYSFGSEIRERSYEYSNEYRYSFNGKEKDNEVYGKGNFQDYGARMYDTRLARFISADPLIVGAKEISVVFILSIRRQ